MKRKTEKDMKRIPVLTDEEVIELGQIMHHQKEDEIAERRFWEKVYGKRGLTYKK